jgi:hypothetical protein
MEIHKHQSQQAIMFALSLQISARQLFDLRTARKLLLTGCLQETMAVAQS